MFTQFIFPCITVNWNYASACKYHAQNSSFLLPYVLLGYSISNTVEGSTHALFFPYKEALGT